MILDVFKFPILFLYLYSPIGLDSYSKTRKWSAVKKIEIDTKYVSGGWDYPKKITQVAFIPILLLVGYFYYKFGYYIRSVPLTEPRGLTAIALGVFVFLIFGFWTKRYLLGLWKILNLENSIDYYCWIFFIIRIQILNSRGIVPVYFSRSFIRYFKSLVLLKRLNARKSEFLTNPENCLACKAKKNQKKSFFDLFKWSIMAVKHTNDDPIMEGELMPSEKEIPEPNAKSKIVCKNCICEYFDRLEKVQKFNPYLKGIHSILRDELLKDS